MSTKICPNCNAEVVDVANLCKHCFHDFHTPVVKRKSPLWTILWFAFGSAIVSAAAFGYISSQHKTQKISVDKETQSIVFTTTYADHTEPSRVFFKDISTVEYLRNTKPRPFQVDVVTTNGERYMYSSSNDPLDYDAKALAETVGKPFVEKNMYEGPETTWGKKAPGQP